MKALLLLAPVVLLGASGCIVVADDPPPPIPVYDPCFSTSECELLADRCFDVTVDHGTHIANDGVCTLNCRDDFDCPRAASGARGTCLSVEGSRFLCWERCLDDFDCPGGFACVDAIGPRTFDSICLPY